MVEEDNLIIGKNSDEAYVVPPEREKESEPIESTETIESAETIKSDEPIESKNSVVSENSENNNSEVSNERVKTGIKNFDHLIEGGFEKNSIVLLVGSAGTGKTLFGLQFVFEGASKYNENSVFISFEESKESLFKHSLQFGWDFEKLEEEKKFKMLFFKPHQITKIIEEGGGQIRDALSQINAKRVVIDSITAYGLLFNDEYKRREKILEFFNLLKKWGVTSVVIAEDSPRVVESKEGSIAFISDAVVSMYYHHDEEKGIRIHSLEILKMRGTKHTNKLCAINFEDDGINVYPDVEVF